MAGIGAPVLLLLPVAGITHASETRTTSGRPVALPPESGVSGRIVSGERWGLEEASLVLTFPEARRVLSGKGGFVSARAVVTERCAPFLVTALVNAEARANAHRAGTVFGRAVYRAVRRALIDHDGYPDPRETAP